MNNISKSKKQKLYEYEDKYSHIPRRFEDRLNWMVDEYKLTPSKMNQVLEHKENMMKNMMYYDVVIILEEEPEGAKRPRFMLSKGNAKSLAMNNFIHVYSPHAKEDSAYMKLLVGNELDILDKLIHTPCIVTYDTYVKTPKSFNAVKTFLCELGLIRNISFPDWDNIGKKYSDASNKNIWIDDSFTVEGTVRKFYSVLPRIEITIRFLNGLYCKEHYNSLINRKNLEHDYSDTPYFIK